jgi:uncharacterized protein (TIGR03083 family)
MHDDMHDDMRGALGAWALGACDGDEAATVGAHVAGCADCRREADSLRAAAELIGTAQSQDPSDALRSRLLGAARALRAPAGPDIEPVLDGYRRQIVDLSALLDCLGPAGPAVRVARHGTIGGLVAHLATNDRALLVAVAPGTDAPAGRWPTQAERLVDRLSTADISTLDQLVPLAGPGGYLRPVRDAAVQRVFETWTHTEDVRAAVGLPPRTPDGRQLRHIVELGVALLPAALERRQPVEVARAFRLRLTGPGGGDWTVPAGGAHDCTIMAEAVDFCRLMAGRLAPDSLVCKLTGEAACAASVLTAAVTLGCD